MWSRGNLHALWNRAFGGVETWLTVALILSLFLVALFRPQQIASKFLFRLSYILLALSIVIPRIIEGLTWSYELHPANLEWLVVNVETVMAAILPVSNMFSTGLFGISLICALSSLKLGPIGPPSLPSE